MRWRNRLRDVYSVHCRHISSARVFWPHIRRLRLPRTPIRIRPRDEVGQSRHDCAHQLALANSRRVLIFAGQSGKVEVEISAVKTAEYWRKPRRRLFPNQTPYLGLIRERLEVFGPCLYPCCIRGYRGDSFILRTWLTRGVSARCGGYGEIDIFTDLHRSWCPSRQMGIPALDHPGMRQAFLA